MTNAPAPNNMLRRPNGKVLRNSSLLLEMLLASKRARLGSQSRRALVRGNGNAHFRISLIYCVAANAFAAVCQGAR